MTSTRPNQHPWISAYENAPSSACATLRAVSNAAEYGLMCVFAEEDGDPLPNSVNTDCLPWATGSVPATSVFYSPAVACPTSWTAVATRTAAEGANDWVEGETALECCPPGFIGGSGGMCNPGTSGTTPVVKCGEADAEENENVVYTAGSWPATLSARVTALQLRYQSTDVGLSASAASTATSENGNLSTSTSTNSPGSGDGDTGLSVGAKAAIGTVVPLFVILGALAAFLLWRRRKNRKTIAEKTMDVADGHGTKHRYEEVSHETLTGSKGTSVATAPANAVTTRDNPNETPEWNTELDATEAERRRYIAVQGSLFAPEGGAVMSPSSPGPASEASELGGMMRVNRKPIAPVELDSTPLTAELNGHGDTEQR
ncbi:hypothetical protein C7974DRAFT_388398 [Boeremia exigua]|uniref:uncharacterized protein n=1 Tax=Boeremia exigua TaxID=749465 RepID=UPI001E8D72F0|nr:uncharacterized protein C7974DRAFT_388398 [Boeremia exigua]KAH6639382.1 hypothetical protein C7974DRAFT_388398 [Boeremia exigua]